MKIGLITATDATDPRSWSGTHYFSSITLSEHVGQVVHIGPIQPASVWLKRIENRVRKALHFGHILPYQTFRVARDNAHLIAGEIERERPDILCTMAGSGLIGFLESNLPILYLSDATARLMFDYYPQFTGLSAAARRQADELEARAIARADILLYPTEWAARSAIEDYGADPGKVHVAPLGANLQRAPKRDQALAPRNGPEIKLLFVAVNWERKGGKIALETLRELVAGGFDAKLTVVGCTPPQEASCDRITVFPFLDKNDPVQAEKLSTLYLEADFLILPTRNECFGIVFCEAAAHGVPSIATATGGVPDVIRDGATGYLLPPEAGGVQYAERIAATISNTDKLATLRRNARDDYETRLNWEAWARRAGALMEEALRTRQ